MNIVITNRVLKTTPTPLNNIKTFHNATDLFESVRKLSSGQSLRFIFGADFPDNKQIILREIHGMEGLALKFVPTKNAGANPDSKVNLGAIIYKVIKE